MNFQVSLEIIICPNDLVKLLALARSDVVRFAHSEVFLASLAKWS